MAEGVLDIWSRTSPYDRWMESQNIPIYEGYYIEDLRTLELGPWDRRGCQGAFLKLAGQEGITQAYVTEIPPGGTLRPLSMPLDELIYVAQGRGLATIWAADRPKKVFEWQKHSLYMLPGGYTHQLSNAEGNQAVRLLHFGYLPLVMAIVPNVDLFFENPFVDLNRVYRQDGGDFYSHARAITRPSSRRGGIGSVWYGNFFPDMRLWDKLQPMKRRGAGGHVVWVSFPESPMYCHMSVFPSRTYKKAHRHGPARVIVVPAGEGYSIMWPEGKEKVIIPWHEASVFVPPNRWFHQHFNVGASPARYLALHPPRVLGGYSERVEDTLRDQIEYPDEETWIRQKFEEELGRKRLTSLMPEEAYRDRGFEWQYQEGS